MATIAGCGATTLAPLRASPAPACTVDAMTLYVAIHPIPHMGGPARPTVTRVLATTIAGLRPLVSGIPSNLASTTPVCYVEEAGPFTVFGPPGATATYARGFQVFSVADWRLLVAGAKN
jgi:hypothetical protein